MSDWKLDYTEYEPLPEGTYDATLKNIEPGDDSQYGPTMRWTFALNGDLPVSEITAVKSAKFSNRSDNYKWALRLGHPAKTSLSSENVKGLIGRPCQLSIIVESGEDDTQFNRIESVLHPTMGMRQEVAVDLPTA